MSVTAGGKGTGTLFNVAVYGMLFVLGAVQGVIGSFQYSRMAGSVPVAALAWCVVLLATCLLGAWAMRSVSGALAPAAGWILAAFLMSMPVPNGSVIITNTVAGRWYLYGGTVTAVAGVLLAFVVMIRSQGRTRAR
jgi:Family of unknown function (DUF6113)